MHCPTKDTPRPQRDAQDTPSHTPCSPRATSSCTQSDTRTLILATSSCTHAALPGTTTHCSTPDTLLRTPPDQLTSHRTLLDVGTSSAHAALWRTLPTLHTFLTPLTAAARNFLIHTLLYGVHCPPQATRPKRFSAAQCSLWIPHVSSSCWALLLWQTPLWSPNAIFLRFLLINFCMST